MGRQRIISHELSIEDVRVPEVVPEPQRDVMPYMLEAARIAVELASSALEYREDV